MKDSIARARDLRKEATGHEDLLWRKLRNRAFAGLKFRRQQPIDGYIADFFCFEKRLIIEIDGAVHLKPDQILYDQERDVHLRNQGFRVVRFTNDQIEKDMNGVLQLIQTAVSDPSPISGEGRGLR